MKSKLLFPLVATLLLLAGCGRIAVGPPLPGEPPEARRLYEQAEKLYASGSLDSALQAYTGYLEQYPRGLQAPAALMKMGAIYESRGRTADARAVYDRLVKTFPDSPLAGPARVNWLATYAREEDYGQVIENAPAVIDALQTDAQRYRAYMLLARAHLEIGDLANAVPALARAHALGDDQQRAEVARTLQQVLPRLSLAELQSLLGSQKDDFTRSALMVRLGEFYLEQERYDEAMAVFEQFLEAYPGHPEAARVREQVAALQGKAGVDRYAMGCLLPLSGPYARIGQRALDAVELAFSQITAAQAGSPLKLVIKDTAGDPRKAVAAVQELARQQVAAIMGPVVDVRAAAEEAQRLRIPMITMTQKAGIAAIGDYVFRNFITPQMQVARIVTYAMERLNARRFAIFFPREKYGTTFMQYFWDEVVRQGGRVTAAESYLPEQTDFADNIKKLVGLYYPIPESLKPPEYRRPDTAEGRKQKPRPIIDFDVLFIPDAPATAGLIIPQLAYYDIRDVYLFGTNLWHSARLIEMAGQYAQGAMMPDGFFAESRSPAVQTFVAAFRSTFNRTPGFIEAAAYDNAMLLLTVIGRQGVRFRGALKERLLNIHPFPGVTGLTQFQQDGEARKNLYLLQIKGRGFEEIANETESVPPPAPPASRLPAATAPAG